METCPLLLFKFHRWKGESRSRYLFRIKLTDNNLPDEGGIYIFVRRHFIFWLEPLYVGKAANLKKRLLRHERWAEAWWSKGATERHVKCIKTERDRQKIEEDLIRRLKPVMNRQLRPRSSEDGPKNENLYKQWIRRIYWRKKRSKTT